MEIDESDILDPEYLNENKALAVLLVSDIVLLNNAHPPYHAEKDKWTTCVYLNCSDTFALGGSDGECLVSTDGEEGSDIIELYKMFKENEKWGSTKWVSLKRNRQPCKTVKNRMIADGYWGDELESLPVSPQPYHNVIGIDAPKFPDGQQYPIGIKPVFEPIE